jgi:RNA polymerase sigma-70 factor (ECF subfamily)
MITPGMQPANPTDADLVCLAQAGDIRSLGQLLERHRPYMLAVAFSILGPGMDAQDAVQDACLLAIRRIGQLRSPNAPGPWLAAIVRRVCLNARRASQHEMALSSIGEFAEPASPLALEAMIDTLALRDWVWTALTALPETLQVVVMLRYFSERSSYAEIAAILSIPVGTVRSRLNESRRRLATSLAATADSTHDAAREVTRTFQQQFSSFLDSYNQGIIDREKIETYAPNVSGVIGGAAFLGRDALERELRADTLAGVKLHPRTVLASPYVAVCEATWENPPEHPFHCPPGMAYVEYIRDEIVTSIRVFHAPRSPLVEA